MLTTAARAYARCWPALLAWFLLGWTARLVLLRIAAAVGNDLPIVGQLILPLAVIARLASYVAMFLVLRAALPSVADADPPDPDRRRLQFLRRWGAAISAAILPFFVIYAAWGMIAEDSRDYAAAALDQADLWGGQSSRALDVVVDVWSLGLVVVAFVGRVLLQRLADRLPAWTTAVAAYLEAVWVLVALLIVREVLGGVPAWFATRRMFAPIVDAVAAWREQQAWFRWLGDTVSWLMAQLGDVLFQPLAWVALAAIVYAGVAARASSATDIRAARARAAVTERWSRLHPRLRAVLTTATGGFQERWLPIAGSLRTIWAAGPLALGGFLLSYAVVHAAGEWLAIGIMRALGPHEYLFWTAVDDPVDLLVVALVIPLQLTLVAAAYDTARRRAADRASAAPADLPLLTPVEGDTPEGAARA
ncbi:MAG: hypothetical protein ACTHMQ_09035 [Protaetiibacter sp.]